MVAYCTWFFVKAFFYLLCRRNNLYTTPCNNTGTIKAEASNLAPSSHQSPLYLRASGIITRRAVCCTCLTASQNSIVLFLPSFTTALLLSMTLTEPVLSVMYRTACDAYKVRYYYRSSVFTQVFLQIGAYDSYKPGPFEVCCVLNERFSYLPSATCQMWLILLREARNSHTIGAGRFVCPKNVVMVLCLFWQQPQVRPW